MNFDIEKEVKSFHTKKNKLTDNFVKRMQTIINSKRTTINQTQATIGELNKKIADDQSVMEQAIKAKNAL